MDDCLGGAEFSRTSESPAAKSHGLGVPIASQGTVIHQADDLRGDRIRVQHTAPEAAVFEQRDSRLWRVTRGQGLLVSLADPSERPRELGRKVR